MLNVNHQEANKVEIMLKNTRVKVGKMNALQIFENLLEEDFIAIHDAGELVNFCNALAIDLQKQNHSYSAFVC